jgi:hypothetical protein
MQTLRALPAAELVLPTLSPDPQKDERVVADGDEVAEHLHGQVEQRVRGQRAGVGGDCRCPSACGSAGRREDGHIDAICSVQNPRQSK